MEDINIEIVDNEEELVDFLNEIDDCFPVPLSKKVNILDYAQKALELGINIFAKKGNSVIGICMGYVNDTKNKVAYISTIAVLPKYRNLKIGNKLINEFKICAKNNKMKIIKLYVHSNNKNAIKFYERNGFKSIDEKANYEYNITMCTNIL